MSRSDGHVSRRHGRKSSRNLTIVLLRTHDPCASSLQRGHEAVDQFGIHVLVPGRVSRSTLFRGREVPFRPRCDPRLSLVIGGAKVNHLDVTLKRLVDEVAAMGVIPPLADSGRVGPEAEDERVRKGGVPHLGQGGDVLDRCDFDPEAARSRHDDVSIDDGDE